MPTTRATQKLETRRRVLEAAGTLFDANGYEATTTRQIAQACQVSIGTVFAHFPNKQALLHAVLYDGIEAALDRARHKLTTDTGADEAMATFAASLYKFYAAQKQLSQELLNQSLFDTEAFAAQLQRFREELMSYIPDRSLTTQDKETRAEALLSHYFFVLITLLNTPDMSAQQAVNRLRRLNGLVLI